MDGRYDNVIITNEIKDLFFEFNKYVYNAYNVSIMLCHAFSWSLTPLKRDFSKNNVFTYWYYPVVWIPPPHPPPETQTHTRTLTKPRRVVVKSVDDRNSSFLKTCARFVILWYAQNNSRAGKSGSGGSPLDHLKVYIDLCNVPEIKKQHDLKSIFLPSSSSIVYNNNNNNDIMWVKVACCAPPPLLSQLSVRKIILYIII